MNEEQFNMDVRKFLKQFGVTAQREIEKAVQQGLADRTFSGRQQITVRATLTIDGTETPLVVEEDVRIQ